MNQVVSPATPVVTVDRERRFGGIARLYGPGSLERLERASVCVIGVGGVGSPAVEALARSGVGSITLIDLDHVAESNINRQIHALESTLGQAKVDAMRERILAINPQARVTCIDDFLTPENAATYLRGFDMVLDAIDNVRAKVAMAVVCRDAGLRMVMAGGAGGKTDPARVRVDDLSRTQQDPLLAKVRRLLRSGHGYPRDPRRRFGIEAVYSEEPLRLPAAADEGVSCAPQGLACAGYGSSMVVTATVGLIAASRVLEALLVDDGD
jgi:tRNA A37 threonylcarbamoyladenosine dehydratase